MLKVSKAHFVLKGHMKLQLQLEILDEVGNTRGHIKTLSEGGLYGYFLQQHIVSILTPNSLTIHELLKVRISSILVPFLYRPLKESLVTSRC